MSIAIYDTTVQDALGRALSGATVYFCTQPANTTVFPPSPLATIFSNTTGTVLAQPVITNGFGLAVAYLTTGTLYTVVVNHPLFATPQVYADQQVGGGTGNSVTPVNASTAAGTITGTIPGAVFVLPSTPSAGSLILQQNLGVLTVNLGYAISGATITLATPLAAGEVLSANYLLVS